MQKSLTLPASIRRILLGGTAALALAGAAFAQDDQVITKQYDDGGVYEGTFKDGLQHGTGSYKLPNGYEYTGEWVEGEIRGQGTARFPNGSIYEGEFANGKPEGEGKITFADGGTYVGDWVDGKIEGQGTAMYANGVRYEGGFRNARHHGLGRMERPSGYVYDGQWVDGVIEGQGTVTYPDGACLRRADAARRAGRRRQADHAGRVDLCR